MRCWRGLCINTSTCSSRTSESHLLPATISIAINVQEKSVTNAQIWKCTKVVLLTHFTCEFPLIYLFHPICCYFGMATYQVPFSPVALMAAQIAFFFVFEDMFHYFAHRALHWGPLYKNIHKLHHEFSAPIGLVSLSYCCLARSHEVWAPRSSCGQYGGDGRRVSCAVRLRFSPFWSGNVDL